MNKADSQGDPTREEVETIKARAERATKGLYLASPGNDPWSHHEVTWGHDQSGMATGHAALHGDNILAQRDLIAHARTDIITLCDWVLSLLPPPAPERKDDWIPWSGGECPVERGTHVATRFRNGYECEGDAPENLRWRHNNLEGDIIAYRPVTAEGERR